MANWKKGLSNLFNFIGSVGGDIYKERYALDKWRKMNVEKQNMENEASKVKEASRYDQMMSNPRLWLDPTALLAASKNPQLQSYAEKVWGPGVSFDDLIKDPKFREAFKYKGIGGGGGGGGGMFGGGGSGGGGIPEI